MIENIELKAAAQAYYEVGFNVVTVKGKQPLQQWQKWTSERQKQEEFNNLNFLDGDGIGVICGTKNLQGLYLAVIDFDVKKLPDETIEKGKQVLKKLPITQIEQTPSGGQHWIYYVHNKPKSVSTFHNEAALELIGENKLCIMAPSRNYKRLNDNSPTAVNDLEDLFYNALHVVGIKPLKQSETWFDREDLEGKAYDGNDPFCIREIMKGVTEGLRNETAIRLSSYLVNFQQLDVEKAFARMQKWNKWNAPSLDKTELENIFSSAIKGKYVFGCSDPILKSYCDEKLFCPLRKKAEPQEKKTVLNAETEAKIQTELQVILDAENQLDALTPHLDSMLEGETNTKKAVAVLNLSSKCKQSEMKQIILFKATEGAGKSTLMKVTTKGYKVKDVGRFSAHALDYTNLEGFEILSLKELGAMDEETQGVSTIKFLSSDDAGYTVEVTVRDEEGRFTTEQHKIPAITVTSSTTRLLLDPQFERRAWLFGLDETPEQTQRIAEFAARQERQKAEKILGYRSMTEEEFSSEVYSRFIEQFQPKQIIIPFPQTLLKTLGFSVLRVRGDLNKLLTFAKLYAMLNAKRLDKIKEDIYVLNPDVAIEALNIALAPMASMLSKIDDRTKALFNVLKEIKGIKEGEVLQEEPVSYCKKDAEITKAIREQIAVKLNKSERTVRAFFSQLEASGYVSGDQRKPKTYTLLYDVEEIEEKLSGILDKTKSADSLKEEMRKEAQEWLRIGLEKNFPRMGIKNLDVPSQEDKKIMPYREKKISNPDLGSFGVSFSEGQEENRQNEKLPITQAEGLIQCEFCAKQNKRLFFSKPEDLKSHVIAFHGGYTDYVR